MTNLNELPQALIETLAGFSAGVATTLVVHPLDLIKTRLQVDRASSSRFGSSIRLARNIARNEGGALAFYRGLVPNLVGNSVSWALYFLWYDKVKNGLSAYHGAENDLSYYDYFVASGAAGLHAMALNRMSTSADPKVIGALTAACTNPIWVIKTRMLATSSDHVGAYSSILDGARRIYRYEGISGFYRGLVPSLFGVSHGAFQFMAYEQMKKYRSHILEGRKRELGNFDYLLFSGVSKIFAGSVTYPYQVVRARLQTYDADKIYKSARDVMVQVWKQEGLPGFYKGLGPNLLRVVPSTCVTFLVYENVKFYLPRISGEKD